MSRRKGVPSVVSQLPYLTKPYNAKRIAETLGCTPRAVNYAIRRLAELKEWQAEGWECAKCGRPIVGRSDKEFCSDSCRGHYHRDLRRLERKMIWAMAQFADGEL